LVTTLTGQRQRLEGQEPSQKRQDMTTVIEHQPL
jgi:hypothetical protein